MKSVLITGVSSGIGLDTARELITHDFTVFGSVRNKADAQKLSERLGDKFIPVFFDVREKTAITAAALQIKQVLEDHVLTGLINNAGIAVAGPLMHLGYDELKKQFDVNVCGVMNVIREFLPLLRAEDKPEQKPGKIINISSVSGGISYPFIGPYAASKHALESLSHSLRRELMLYGIDVLIIAPGTTETKIWEKAEKMPDFSETDYSEIIAHLKESILGDELQEALPVEKVSRLIRRALLASKPKTKYLILKHKFMGWYLPRLIPARWLDKMIAHRLGL